MWNVVYKIKADVHYLYTLPPTVDNAQRRRFLKSGYLDRSDSSEKLRKRVGEVIEVQARGGKEHDVEDDKNNRNADGIKRRMGGLKEIERQKEEQNEEDEDENEEAVENITQFEPVGKCFWRDLVS